MTRDEASTRGRIQLFGADVSALPPARREVNTVFQDYALFPHMSVGDNVGYGLMVRRVPRAERERRVAEALRRMRLEGYEQRRPAQLSGGITFVFVTHDQDEALAMSDITNRR